MSTVHHSGPRAAAATIGSTIHSTAAALPTQTGPLRTNMGALPGAILGQRDRRTHARTRGNSVADNRRARWIGAAEAGDKPGPWESRAGPPASARATKSARA